MLPTLLFQPLHSTCEVTAPGLGEGELSFPWALPQDSTSVRELRLSSHSLSGSSFKLYVRKEKEAKTQSYCIHFLFCIFSNWGIKFISDIVKSASQFFFKSGEKSFLHLLLMFKFKSCYFPKSSLNYSLSCIIFYFAGKYFPFPNCQYF